MSEELKTLKEFIKKIKKQFVLNKKYDRADIYAIINQEAGDKLSNG